MGDGFFHWNAAWGSAGRKPHFLSAMVRVLWTVA